MRSRSLTVSTFSLLCAVVLFGQPGLAKGTTAGYAITAEVEAQSKGHLIEEIEVVPAALIVSQVYGLDLILGTRTATLAAGAVMYSPQTVANIGNGSETYKFSLSGTTPDFSSTLIKDDDGDSAHSPAETNAVPLEIVLAEDAVYPLFVALSSPVSAGEGAQGETILSVEGSVQDAGPYLGSNGVTYGGVDALDSLVQLFVSSPSDRVAPTISDVLIKGKKRFPQDVISASFEVDAVIVDNITNNLDRIHLKLTSNDSGLAVIDLLCRVGATEPAGCYYDPVSGKYKYVASAPLPPGSYSFLLEAWDKFENTAAVTVTPLLVRSAEGLEMIGPGLNYPNPFSPLKGQVTTLAYTLSTDAPITLYIYDLHGRKIWQRTYPLGGEGGAAGYNEVTFSGFSDFGDVLGNGVYLFQVTCKNKVIGKGKFTIFDVR